MTPDDFIAQVVKPALTAIGLDTPDAEAMLLGTAIQESGLQNVVQHGGPAIGYFQMEPATHDDCWTNYLSYHPTLASAVRGLADGTPDAGALFTHPQYAAAMCRVKYLRCPGALPAADDLEGQAAYWKQWYNTPQGAGTVAEYINNYNRVVAT